MCIILETVRSVSKTRIYTTVNEANTHQILVYQNTVDTQDGNTMILPVPKPGSVKFVNLERYPNFFDDCEKCFKEERNMYSASYSCSLRSSTPQEPLPVFHVGSYQVSIAPSVHELHRADSRIFQLDPALETLLQDKYESHFGFLLCRLRPGSHTYHPLAYVHEKDPCRLLFVPTLHYHSHTKQTPGHMNTTDADWDHRIYSTATDLDSTWEDKMYCDTTQPIKWQYLPKEFHNAAAKKMLRWTKYGDWINKDLWLAPKN